MQSLNNVPSTLRAHKAWLLWQSKTFDGETKPRKIPYYANGDVRRGAHGSDEDRARLVTYDKAMAALARRGEGWGLGFALMPEWGVTALDFDGCVDVVGRVRPDVQSMLLGTYAEVSPSGRGVRAFVLGNLGNHKSHAGEKYDYGFETFATKGFVTVTGNILDAFDLIGCDVVSEPAPELLALVHERFGESRQAQEGERDPGDPLDNLFPRLGKTVDEMESLLEALDPDMGRDDWIRVGMGLHHETEGDDTGFELWDEWSSGGNKYPSTEDLRVQWASFADRRGRRPVTLATVVKMAKEAGWTDPKRPTSAAAEIRRELSEAAPSAPREANGGRFRFHDPREIINRRPPPWLIKGVLPRGDVCILFGAPGSGKSFVAFDMGAAVARGIPWQGRKTTKGRAGVIVAEGSGGAGNRVKAYCAKYNLEPEEVDIKIMTAAPNFLEKEDIKDVIDAVKAAGPMDLMIVDTFAQVTPGANENAGEDMGLALGNAKLIKETTGATVLLIHHAGKDQSKGARGWSGIKAAADAEIEVLRHDTGAREVKITKMKDGEDGLSWPFALETVLLGTDEDGEPVTSCVISAADARPVRLDTEARSGVRRVGRVAQHILDTMDGIDKTLQSMRLDAFVERCVGGMPTPEPDQRDARRQHVMRAIRVLAKMDEAPLSLVNGVVIFGR